MIALIRQTRLRVPAFCHIVVGTLYFTWLSIPAIAQPVSARGTSKVSIILWFDTEDYILPQSDDAAKHIAEMLTRLGVRATFKIVGEKARVLEQRGRKDVINALKKHEIGYHSNFHSQHPTPAEYEEQLDWRMGAQEFSRRERAGFVDVARIFGQKPSCYGQPGSSWSPQSYAALKSWGVNVYLDEAQHVGLNGKPFWYGGLLNIFNTREGGQLRARNDWSNLEDAKAKFVGYHKEMTAGGGGIISIYFHPCEFIHKEFWDGVNFAKGANPPRAEWKEPEVVPLFEQNRRYQFLEDLVKHLKSFRDVQFITANQAARMYEDRARRHRFTTTELIEIASRVTSDISFQERGDLTLSPSDVFSLLNKAVSQSILKLQSPIQLSETICGPSHAAPVKAIAPALIPWSQFAQTVLDVETYIQSHQQIPDVVWFGSLTASPENYLVSLARVARDVLSGKEHPKVIALSPASLATSKFVARDSTAIWDWVIFPQGFHAPNLMELARLQAWTLKPAVLHTGN